MTRHSRLVRAARWLIAAAADPDDRPDVLADFDDGVTTAAWAWSQTARSVPALVRARWRARRRRAGGVAATGRSHRWLASSWRDARQAVRSLRRRPAFAIVSIATLAVGIGGATAAFAALDVALLRPLSYPNHARLTVLSETRKADEISVSYPDYEDWRARARSFEVMAAFRGQTVTLTGGDTPPERIRGQVVSANLLQVLGTPPLIGHAFDASSDRPGAPPAVLVGYGLWQRRFAGDPGLVGRTIQGDGVSIEVAGVMPRGFDFPSGIIYDPAELYLSSGAFWEADLAHRDSHPGLEVIGLRRPHVTAGQAREEMLAIAAALRSEHPDTNRDTGALVRDAVDVIVGDLGGRLRAVTAAALALLLIACANVAGLTLTQAMSRRRELAVRAALGAGRAALVATIVWENVVLASAGAAAGAVFAVGLTGAMRPLLADLPRLDALVPDVRFFAFTAVLMAATAIACSLAPVLWLRRAPLDPWLRARGQAARGWRTRQLLVGAQAALALTLLATAVLLAASLRHMQARTGGIAPDDVLVFGMRLPDRAYGESALVPFFDELYGRLRVHPTVAAVGGITTLPFSGNGAQTFIQPHGGDDASRVRTDVAVVTREYFRAMGMTLVRGRAFDDRDGAQAPRVAVVDERFAARVWPAQSPIGRHLRGWGVDDLEVIGVVGHVDNYGVGEPSREELFMHLPQRPRSQLSTVVRATAPIEPIVDVVRSAVRSLDPSLAVSGVRTMRSIVDATTAGARLTAVLSSGFGVVALLLAGVGIYATVSYSVELRRREAGVRLALGASPINVVRLMAVGVLAPMIAGTVVGLAGALAAGRLLREQLFDVPPNDPRVLAASAVALLLLATAASWVPARRAGRVPPTVALQED